MNYNNQKIVNETEYSINNQTEIEQCTICIYAETVQQVTLRGTQIGIYMQTTSPLRSDGS
jgi:hypothetical protein